MKHCYIRVPDEDAGWWLIDDHYIEVMLITNDAGELMCHLGGSDDWELSYTGPDAEDKFNALLDMSGEINHKHLIQLGFSQYG